MQIPPRDQRRLLYRVCAVLIAMRAVSIFTIDLNATEVAAAWGLVPDGVHMPGLARLTSAWKGVAGHIAGVLRLPSIAADLATVLVTIAYARLNGWGSLAGLMAGFMLAMAPFGLDEGWRGDGTPLISLGAVGALLLARKALKLGTIGPAIGSGAVIAAMTACSPVTAMLLPAGLYAAVRSVTGPAPRYAVIGGWLGGFVVGIGARAAVGIPLGPGMTLAQHWLADPSLNGAGGALPGGAVEGGLAAFAALSPGGPEHGFSRFLQVLPAPQWRVWTGAALWPLAVVGLARGQVIADPVVPSGAAASSAGGAGAVDGWRSLGVAAPTSPRVLGERDWGPLAIGLLLCCGWVAWASAAASPAGIAEALAIGRPLACLLLGLGLTAFSGMRWGPEELRRRRFVAIIVGVTLLQFAIGGHHVLSTTAADERMAPGKIARFVHGETRAAKVVALGPAGLAVAYKMDPYRTTGHVALASIEPAATGKAVASVLAAGPSFIVLTGDKEAIEDNAFDPAATASAQAARGAGWLAHKELAAADFEVIEDGARFLSWFSVRVYSKQDRGARQVKPQLQPGVPPE